MKKFTAVPWTTDLSQSFYVKAPDGTVICNANTRANQELIREAAEMARALEAAKVALLGIARLAGDRSMSANFQLNTIADLAQSNADEAAAVLVNAVGEG